MQAQFSLIVAVYNVEEYIGDFLESLERQTYGLDRLDIVLVDDGSRTRPVNWRARGQTGTLTTSPG